MPRYRDFADGGRLRPADLNTLQDDVLQRLGWRNIHTWATRGAEGVTAGDRVEIYGVNAGGFYLDPDDYAVVGLAAEFRLRASLVTNTGHVGATGVKPFASGGNLWAAVYVGGTSGGTQLCKATFADPSANSVTLNTTTPVDGSTFTAGRHALGWGNDATIQTNGHIALTITLQVRNV